MQCLFLIIIIFPFKRLNDFICVFVSTQTNKKNDSIDDYVCYIHTLSFYSFYVTDYYVCNSGLKCKLYRVDYFLSYQSSSSILLSFADGVVMMEP